MTGKAKYNYWVDMIFLVTLLVVSFTGVVLWGWSRPHGMQMAMQGGAQGGPGMSQGGAPPFGGPNMGDSQNGPGDFRGGRGGGSGMGRPGGGPGEPGGPGMGRPGGRPGGPGMGNGGPGRPGNFNGEGRPEMNSDANENSEADSNDAPRRGRPDFGDRQGDSPQMRDDNGDASPFDQTDENAEHHDAQREQGERPNHGEREQGEQRERGQRPEGMGGPNFGGGQPQAQGQGGQGMQMGDSAIFWGLLHGKTFWGMNKRGWTKVHEWVSVIMFICFILHLQSHFNWLFRRARQNKSAPKTPGQVDTTRIREEYDAVFGKQP